MTTAAEALTALQITLQARLAAGVGVPPCILCSKHVTNEPGVIVGTFIPRDHIGGKGRAFAYVLCPACARRAMRNETARQNTARRIEAAVMAEFSAMVN